jgi:hypothetical protein
MMVVDDRDTYTQTKSVDATKKGVHIQEYSTSTTEYNNDSRNEINRLQRIS